MFDADPVIALLRDLVAIDSVNPTLVPGARGEADVARRLADELRACGLAVEIADNTPLRTRGLMWRSELPDGTGMLFIFPAEVVQSFWMRNTLIPLDLVFIDKGMRVVGVVQWAEPRTLTSRTVGKPSLYVLEVPGGWASKNGVRAGSTVELEGPLKTRPGQP